MGPIVVATPDGAGRAGIGVIWAWAVVIKPNPVIDRPAAPTLAVCRNPLRFASVRSTTEFSLLACGKPVALSECENISAHTGIEELDLESPVCDRPRLPDELIKAVFLQTPPSFGVHVKAMVSSGRSAIDRDAKANRLTLRMTAQYEVKIAGVEAIGDAAA
jgi:hypothetical protein